MNLLQTAEDQTMKETYLHIYLLTDFVSVFCVYLVVLYMCCIIVTWCGEHGGIEA